MKHRKTRWLLVGMLCLALWPVPASAQETRWDNLNNAAIEAYQRADYAEAEKLLLAALKEAEKFGPEDPRLAITLASLTVVHDAQILGPEHPALAASLNNLAELYRAQAKYAQA
ncbi:MAG: tetratricopeptide repeat protein, partial [Candidatus Acidoferrales bacterium]